MKKLFLGFALLAVLNVFAFAQNVKSVKLKSSKSEVIVSDITQNGFTVNLSVSNLNLLDIATPRGNFELLGVEGFVKAFGTGQPNLPVYTKLFEIPQNARVVYKVIQSNEEIINLSDYGISNKLLPSQPSISKSDDLNNLKFYLNEDIYNKNDFYSNDLVQIEDAGMMRHTRLSQIAVSPFSYNPVTNELKVINNLSIAVTFEGADFAKTNMLKEKYASPYFGNIANAINYDNKGSRALINATPVTYVIVADRMFETQLQPFIEWKELKGFHVIVAYTDVIGTTTTAIKTYLQDLYDNPAVGVNAPSFVLFVGDVQQIPAYSGTSGSHVTDLYYCEYTGDLIPEVFYGRFSAQNTTQLQPQIDKSLEYEKYLMPDPSYLGDALMVAGEDASHQATYGNGQINYGTTYYFNADHGLYSHTILQPYNSSNAHDTIIASVSDGVAYGNYTAHCSPSGWAAPSFENSDIPSLTNAHKYGLLVGNCCQSVQFNDNECFGEAILRAQDKGSIGYIGGSNSTYWDEDYWWGVGLTASITANPTYEGSGLGAYDRMFHDHGEPTTEWFITQAQMNVAGNLAVQASSSTRKTYYWEIYHLMGDPSIIPYMGIPALPNVVANPAAIVLGMTSLDITTEPNAYVAFSQNGVLIATAMADSTSGVATLNFEANAVTVGDADLVITGQNIQPYIGTIGVVPADQPYVVMNQYTTSASPDYGTNIHLSLNLKNVATAGSGYNAENVTAIIRTSDEFITILDSTENYGTIAAGDSTTIDNGFQIQINNLVPDQHAAQFQVLISGNDKTNYEWVSTMNLVCNAPELSLSDYTMSNDPNSNGRLDPGETLDLTFGITNSGHAVCNNPVATLTGNSAYMGINPSGIAIDPISVGGTEEATYAVTANSAAAQGTIVDLTFTVIDIDTVTGEHTIVIGQAPEITIGTGTEESTYYPFYTYYENNKSEMLYLGSEIGAGEVVIQELGFDFSTIGLIPQLTNLVINLKATDLTSLGSAYPDMSGATTVFSAASFTMPTATGLYMFDIDDFTIDATSNNLIVEVIWGDNGAWDDAFKVYCTNTAFTSVTYGYADDQTPPSYDGNSTSRPNLTLAFEGEAPGTLRTVNFTVKDQLSNNPIENAGVMVGSLTQMTDVSGQTSFTLYESDYTYSVSHENYVTATDNITVDGDEDVTVTLSPESIIYTEIGKFIIYPVPTKDRLTVESELVVSTFEIYSEEGKLIMKDNPNSMFFTFSLKGVKPSVYIMKVHTYKGFITTKIQLIP